MEKKLLQHKAIFQVKAVDNAQYIIEGVFSTAEQDWHGEVIDQAGWVLDTFLSNPVILLAHNDCGLPIGKCIELGVNAEGNLAGKIQFAAEEYDVAMTTFKLYAGGFMRAFSVGFMCEENEMAEDGTMVLKKNTLYEISCVAIPANPMALALQKGINTAPLEKALRAQRLKELEDLKKEEAQKEPEKKEEQKEEAKEEPKEETDEQKAEKALSALPKKVKIIRDAIGTLTCLLKSITEADNQGDKEKSKTPETGGNPQAQVKLFNKAVRELLAAKKL